MIPPLTKFLIDLRGGKLRSSDPDRLAAKYGISPTHARGYIDMARGW